MLTRRQTANGLAVLHGVQERAHREKWDRWQAHHMAVLTIMCTLAEAELHNYGNVASSESQQLADPVPAVLRPVLGPKYIGSDHDSCGVFQQRASWGSVANRMDPKWACHAFMRRAAEVGVDTRNGLPNRLDVQRVQVSFDASGWNYGRQRFRARRFIRRHWDSEAMSVREPHRRRRNPA